MDTKNLFIVVIDDSMTVCQILEVLLTQEGHQVTCFQHPVPAIRSLLRAGEIPLPDLLFIDLSLPSIDGYKVVRLLRKDPASEHIPIIVISRLDDTVARLKARLAGANAYLAKPFQIQDVLSLVRSVTTFPISTPHENE